MSFAVLNITFSTPWVLYFQVSSVLRTSDLCVHPIAYLTSLLNCLTEIPKLRAPALNILFPPCHNLALSTICPLLENFNPVLPAAQAKSLKSFLILLFLSHTASNPSVIIGAPIYEINPLLTRFISTTLDQATVTFPFLLEQKPIPYKSLWGLCCVTCHILSPPSLSLFILFQTHQFPWATSRSGHWVPCPPQDLLLPWLKISDKISYYDLLQPCINFYLPP